MHYIDIFYKIKKMRSLILIIFSIYFSPTLMASNIFFKDITCMPNVFKVLEKLGTPKKWNKIEKDMVRTSLEEGGVLTLTNNKKYSRISLSSKKESFSIIFKKGNCVPGIEKEDVKDGRFSDEDLTALLKKHDKGFLYLWSPHMSLSVLELKELIKSQSKLSVPITFLMDSKADLNHAEFLLKGIKNSNIYFKMIGSKKLIDFGMTIHYPSLVFYKNNKLLIRIPGYSGVKSIKKYIEKYL
jgi:hypothetical protein